MRTQSAGKSTTLSFRLSENKDNLVTPLTSASELDSSCGLLTAQCRAVRIPRSCDSPILRCVWSTEEARGRGGAGASLCARSSASELDSSCAPGARLTV